MVRTLSKHSTRKTLAERDVQRLRAAITHFLGTNLLISLFPWYPVIARDGHSVDKQS